jgi:hypothetical protein
MAQTTQLTPGPFSSLSAPSGGLQGTLAAVNDSPSNVPGTAIGVGGGQYVCLLWCDGSSWVVVAS